VALRACDRGGAGMSFSAELRRELARRGIRGRLARRIELGSSSPSALRPSLAIGVGSTFTEHSVGEGPSRAVIEAAALAGCFAVLGRRLSVRR
jgi:hypothetical protein